MPTRPCCNAVDISHASRKGIYIYICPRDRVHRSTSTSPAAPRDVPPIAAAWSSPPRVGKIGSVSPREGR